jgi:hypothetical protein
LIRNVVVEFTPSLGSWKSVGDEHEAFHVTRSPEETFPMNLIEVGVSLEMLVGCTVAN